MRRSRRASATRRRSPPESLSTSCSGGGHRRASIAISTWGPTSHAPRASIFSWSSPCLAMMASLAASLGARVQLVPRGVVGPDEVGQVLDALLDAFAHGPAGLELRLLLQQADVVARLDVHAALDLGVAKRKNAHEGRLSRPVESEDADLGPVEERKRDVAQDLLALDLLRDADHREDDLGLFGLCHSPTQTARRPAASPAVRALWRGVCSEGAGAPNGRHRRARPRSICP